MELIQYLLIIRKRLPLLIIISLSFVILSTVYTRFMMKPLYASTISIIVGENKNTGTDKPTSYTSYSDLYMYEMLVKTYGQLAKSRAVAEDVIRNLNLQMYPDAVAGMITATPKQDSQFLSITVRAGEAKLAMDIANETARVLKRKSIELGKGDNIFILDDALLPGGPYSPSLRRNAAIALFLGLMISVGIIFLIEYMDSTVKTQEDAEMTTDIPVIGIIPIIAEE
jgi:capsular polysaccharide biosynthesis protein